MTNSKPLTATERKRNQIDRERAAGWKHIKLKCAPDQVEAVRAFVESLPGPQDKPLPGQQALPLFNM